MRDLVGHTPSPGSNGRGWIYRTGRASLYGDDTASRTRTTILVAEVLIVGRRAVWLGHAPCSPKNPNCMLCPCAALSS